MWVRIPALACLVLSGRGLVALSAGAEWLAIAGSHTTVSAAIERKVRIEKDWPNAKIIDSNDCEDFRPGLFVVVAAAARDVESANADLARLRKNVADAYMRKCRAKPSSRYVLGVPLVDPSIEKVPTDAVNWTDRDRVSSVEKLPDGGYLWIRRRYQAAAEDPREGRRESVLFFATKREEAVQLEADCTDPSFSQRGRLIALSCARETAADHLLHELRVFQVAPVKVVFTASRCRNPQFVSGEELICQAEEMYGDGKLRLQPRRLHLH